MEKKPTLTEAQIADLKEAFAVFDLDKDGRITPTELKTLMDRVLGNAMSKDEIDAIIKSVDADLSGTIEFDEFLTLMSDPKFCNPDERRQVFDMFDKDGSGHICIVELKDAFRKLGQRLDDDEFEAMLKEADLNGDRLIDFDEFVQMLGPAKNIVC